MDIKKIIICDECKHEFTLHDIRLQTTNVVIGNKRLELLYYTCSECDKIYKVLLKDEKFYRLKKDLDECIHKINKFGSTKDKNAKMATMLESMFIKKKNRLDDYTSRLNAKYSGTFTFVSSENKYEENNIIYVP